MVRFFQVWFVTICETVKSIGLLRPCELNTAEIATSANWCCCGDIALENHVILYPKYIVELRTAEHLLLLQRKACVTLMSK